LTSPTADADPQPNVDIEPPPIEKPSDIRPDRYEHVPSGWFRRCGASGLKLPAISLGFWHNFGRAGDASIADKDSHGDNCKSMVYTAFDRGITHFDLANNYGPPPGSAEKRAGRILKKLPRREIVVSTKSGFLMWPGPYGEWGSRKQLLTSLDESLQRLKMDYVDIFYHHRPDPDTPLEETMGALDHAVRSGKALYCGVSNYSGEQFARAIEVCEREGFVKPIIHQQNYSMLNRTPETDLFPKTQASGVGVIAFCPLAGGRLTPKYLDGIPSDSRAASPSQFLKAESIDDALRARANKLNTIAAARGQSLTQMALTWVIRNAGVCSALIGASRPGQIMENVKAAEAEPLSADELKQIDAVLGDA